MASEFITNPKDLIAVADLKQILLIDKGAHVLYDSYQIASYLGNDRSRFGSMTVRIKVFFLEDNSKIFDLYMVKMYSSPQCLLDQMYRNLFQAEENFHAELLPLLNEELRVANEPPLCVPKFLHSVFGDKFALLFFKDLLREQCEIGTLPLSSLQVRLVINELARFHAASMLVLAKRTKENEKSKPYIKLADSMSNIKKLLEENKVDMVESSIFTGIAVCDQFEKYKYVSDYLRNLKKMNEVWEKLVAPSDKLSTIRHGNLKVKNLLFR